jgi:hypothetical protein
MLLTVTSTKGTGSSEPAGMGVTRPKSYAPGLTEISGATAEVPMSISNEPLSATFVVSVILPLSGVSSDGT